MKSRLDGRDICIQIYILESAFDSLPFYPCFLKLTLKLLIANRLKVTPS